MPSGHAEPRTSAEDHRSADESKQQKLLAGVSTDAHRRRRAGLTGAEQSKARDDPLEFSIVDRLGLIRVELDAIDAPPSRGDVSHRGFGESAAGDDRMEKEPSHCLV